MDQKSTPTMKDVAREAGVALGTVSKVINGVYVSDTYRLKVEAAIEKLNYEVNTYARGLKTSKTQTLTLIVPSLSIPFYAQFAYEIEQQAYRKGRKLILCCSDGIPEKEIEYLSLASQSKTDGIIALTYSDINNQVPEHIPLIAFDRLFTNCSISRIASDNFSGGVIATEKLIELGCKRPAFLGFHSEFPGEADKRFDGYLDVCKRKGMEPLYLYEVSDIDIRGAVFRFIKTNQKEGMPAFDGIFANTDYHAVLAISVLNEMGYSVPEDIQVIGFDGTRKFYPSEEYVCSTICQPVQELARKSVDLLINADAEPLPSLTLLPVTYHYGGTTRETEKEMQ